MARRASSCPCPLLCYYLLPRRFPCLRSKRALADQSIAECRSGLFLRNRKYVGSSFGSDPEGLGRSYEMVICIDDIDAGQFVAVPIADSLDGEPTHLQTEPGILLEQVTRCAAKRARVRAASVGKFKSEIQKAGVF